jgi:glucokinase
MSQPLYAAIDVGGTKIAAALVDAGGTLLTRSELPTPPKGAGEEVMATVAKLVAALAEDERWSKVVGLGIGSAGPVDPVRGTVSPVNIPGWRDFPLVERVRELEALGEIGVMDAATDPRPRVVLVGDGSAMAAGEHWRGAARGYDNALCLVVSTGVGAGLILDGVLRTGPSGNAGHLGHISVDIEGEDCPCGSRGCVEIIASGTSIARWALQHGWPALADNVVQTFSRKADSRKAEPGADSGRLARATLAGPGAATLTATAPVTAADIAESAREGNEIALAAFDRAGRALAAGIAATAMLADIRAAVIGGGVAKAGDVLFDPLRRHLTRYASLPFTQGLDILPATLGGDAGLIGAAALAAQATKPN